MENSKYDLEFEEAEVAIYNMLKRNPTFNEIVVRLNDRNLDEKYAGETFRHILSSAMAAYSIALNADDKTLDLLTSDVHDSSTYVKRSVLIDRLTTVALMHDAGKLDVPLEILESSRRLSKEEREIVSSHTTNGESRLGEAIIKENGFIEDPSRVPGNLRDENRAFMADALMYVAKNHHTPSDTLGENIIDYYSRMITAIDIAEALSAKRSYKLPFKWTENEAKKMINPETGEEMTEQTVEGIMKSDTARGKIYEPFSKLIMSKGDLFLAIHERVAENYQDFENRVENRLKLAEKIDSFFFDDEDTDIENDLKGAEVLTPLNKNSERF